MAHFFVGWGRQHLVSTYEVRCHVRPSACIDDTLLIEAMLLRTVLWERGRVTHAVCRNASSSSANVYSVVGRLVSRVCGNLIQSKHGDFVEDREVHPAALVQASCHDETMNDSTEI